MKRIDIVSEISSNICEDYKNGIRGFRLSKKYNFSPGKIYKTLRESGFEVKDTSRRKYNIDETIFHKIDCEWKAYLLGLIYADGCVRKLNVTLGAHPQDKEMMEKLSSILKCGLKYSSPKTYNSKGKVINNNGFYYFNINSKKVVADIIKLGCSPRKSLTLTFPSYDIVPPNLFHHFIRGYFDGDGCIQSHTFHIISSDAFCIGFQKWLMDTLNISSYLRKHQKVSRVMVHKEKDRKKIYNFMYKDASLYLERKKIKFHFEIK